jgi:hypothetical protein
MWFYEETVIAQHNNTPIIIPLVTATISFNETQNHLTASDHHTFLNITTHS